MSKKVSKTYLSKFELDEDETASLRSAPVPNKRFYCFFAEVSRDGRDCTTASGARKYFMSEKKLLEHMKAEHKLVFKEKATQPDEEMDVVAPPAKRAKSVKKVESITEEDVDDLVADMDQLNTDSDKSDGEPDDSSVSSNELAPVPTKTKRVVKTTKKVNVPIKKASARAQTKAKAETHVQVEDVNDDFVDFDDVAETKSKAKKENKKKG